MEAFLSTEGVLENMRRGGKSLVDVASPPPGLNREVRRLSVPKTAPVLLGVTHSCRLAQPCEVFDWRFRFAKRTQNTGRIRCAEFGGRMSPVRMH
jgi:hypothetical protein